MSSFPAIHSPLSINLPRLATSLLSFLGPDSPHATSISSAMSPSALLDTISRLLYLPTLTCKIATTYRPILLDLCSRWLLSDDAAEAKLIALCLLVEVHEELFPVLLRLLSTPTFSIGPLTLLDTESGHEPETHRLQRLLLAYYRILQINRELPDQLGWLLSPLIKLIWAPSLDNGIRLMAIRCYALQVGMPEAERDRLQKEGLGEREGIPFPFDYGADLDGRTMEVNAWLIPALEVNRIRDMRNAIVSDPMDYHFKAEGELSLTLADLCHLVVDIHGILLLRSGSSKTPSKGLIATPTAQRSLQQLALNLSLRLPVLLTSPPSSGKALFIRHLADTLHSDTSNQIITIHLADTSLDPRSLLGSYTSSSTKPGTFEWRDGVLVRSMREGKWVVFEDIDRGSNDVLGVIKPLVESLQPGKWIGGRAFINIPSRGRVVAADSFRLFATRSVAVGRNGKFPVATFFGAHKFHEISIPSPCLDELLTILEARFPRLAGDAVRGSINLWEAIKAIGSASSSRDIGLRELEKFCRRMEALLPASYAPMEIDSDLQAVIHLSHVFPHPSLREEIYLEARDIFFGAGTLTAAARVYTDNIATIIATHLGIDDDRRNWLLAARVPEYDWEKDVNGRTAALRIGRVCLPAQMPKAQLAIAPARPFTMHKPATVLLSRIATAVSFSEPVLLTGETGTGKTSVISYLAASLRQHLVSLNLSHQTEPSDLLGGFKPIDARIPASGLQERFLELFGATFSRKKNEKFETEVRKAVHDGKWKRAVGLWKESIRLARERLVARQTDADASLEMDAQTPRKRRRVEGATSLISDAQWAAFLRDVEEFEVQHVHGKGKFAFGFVEGPLVKALKGGHWVLLDEINLASPETLECITGLLHGPTASITLTEQGSLEPVPRHPNFRLFACMNPATDVGKKDLPPNIRSRLTEIDVPPPDADRETLVSIIAQYIGPYAISDKGIIMDVAEFYTAVKQLSEARQVADGSNHRPHFSMRTLARALTFAGDITSRFSLRRAVWEGCLMAFTMVLDVRSAEAVTALAHKHLLAGVRNPRSVLTKEPSIPQGRSMDEFVKFGPFHLEKGPLPEDLADDYIITPSVERKLIDLARIILTRRFPVLIEGPTSSGKTSSIEYLARRTGHRFVRINNHEHTDIQEYIGSYVSDPTTGSLIFKDGLLVRALRNGDWIVLDELNLAPTDVLEALNRLLDDNRELIIPETQEVVKPHPHFMLFATQNPPGLYGGRKVLSRAFRNRFLEVHFDDVPQHELETILCDRCKIAPSYGKKIVTVFHELQKRRQAGRVFESKQGFATLRDLFRWAGRDAVGYQELADNGYMLLAERTRREDDKLVVKEVIESVMKVRIDEKALYNTSSLPSGFLGCPLPSTEGIIWTSAMQRLFVLIARALRFNEPVLLVGETGAGKTSVCQVYADATSQRLMGLNCHQNTETADLIGGLRPVRNRAALEMETVQEVVVLFEGIGIKPAGLTVDALSAHIQSALKHPELHTLHRSQLLNAQQKLLHLQAIFEWHDGPLVEAMRRGDVFLLDEISLADDSVLERLNSVLEPGRTIVLAERAGDDLEHPSICAVDHFKLVATMNPGGDYGKKELSPALRNRFTEIWVPRVDDRADLELIVSHSWKHEELKEWTSKLLDFAEWLCHRIGDSSIAGLRDYLAWVHFSNHTYKSSSTDIIPPSELFYHAAHMTFLDGLASLPQLSSYSPGAIRRLKVEALAKLHDIIPINGSLIETVPVHDPGRTIQLGSFAIARGPSPSSLQQFNLQAPTTRDNAMRVVRACQVPKPILLEGSPGVGKTSLINALANLAGHTLSRINLSDQTDLMDLFGADLPVEGGKPGEFTWKDAEFLTAMQEGHWVLLDEMNLAPQAVLEGLNAVLDHRGTVYIPELGRSFSKHPLFRIFAAQNPINQGGGRKGLPKSFVNRFTKVYVEELSPNDIFIVCHHVFPDLDEAIVRAMITFNMRLNEEVVIKHAFGREGSPWEFNLRDVLRWGSLLRADSSLGPIDAFNAVYLHRFRTVGDRLQARQLFERVFSTSTDGLGDNPSWFISAAKVEVGNFTCNRGILAPVTRPMRVLKYQLPYLESIGLCISQSWLTILTGRHNSGKSGIIRTMANFTGNMLHEIYVNHSTDTMDILGSFEQVDFQGRIAAVVEEVLQALAANLRSTTELGRYYEEYLNLRVIYQQGATPNNGLLSAAANAVTKLSSSSPDTSTCTALKAKIDSLVHGMDTTGKFEWVDGPLIRALRDGHWLLMDGANLCNPSVLDRLNSLCEADGSLVLSERGYVNGKVQVIKPHPNFRLFMTVDPHFGELSRAMRNRGIEIAMLSGPMADDGPILNDFLRLPVVGAFINRMMSPVDYEALRRGIVTSFSDNQAVVASTGRFLDQDTIMSSLVDQSAMIIAAQEELSSAHLYFLARTIGLATLSYLPDFLQLGSKDALTSRIASLLQKSGYYVGVFRQILKDWISSTSITSELVKAQSLDYLLNCSRNRMNTSNYSVIIQGVDLAVAITIEDEQGIPDNDQPMSSNWRHQQAFKSLLSITQGIISVSRLELDSLLSDGRVISEHNLSLCLTLLRYNEPLRAVLRGDSIDYSTLLAIANCLSSSLDECPEPFRPLLPLVNGLSSAISPSSGHGLVDIWSQLFDTGKGQALQEVKTFCSALGEGNDEGLKDTYQRAFDLMAMLTMSKNSAINSDENIASLWELKTTVEDHLRAHNRTHDSGVASPYKIRVNELLLLTELYPITSVKFTGENNSRGLDIALRSVLSVGRELHPPSSHRLTPYQHVLWICEGGMSVNDVQWQLRELLVQMRSQWVEALWNTIPSQDDPFGPEILMQARQLLSVTQLYSATGVTMLNLKGYRQDLSSTIKLLAAATHLEGNRIQQLHSFAYQSLFLVVLCFSARFDQDVMGKLQELSRSFTTPTMDWVDALLTLCQSYQPLRTATETVLVPALQRLRAAASPIAMTEALASVLTSIGRVILDLYVPDVPLDPAALRAGMTNHLQSQRSLLTTQLRLHQSLEGVLTGNNRNILISYLDRELEEVEKRLSEAPSLVQRKDVSRVQMFWTEVWQFQSQVIPPSKLESLRRALHDGEGDAAAREHIIQQSIAGFCQRLETAYPEFLDILLAFKFGINHMRLGLRLLANSSASIHTTDLNEFATDLTSFPTVNSIAGLRSILMKDNLYGIRIAHYLLLQLSTFTLEDAWGITCESSIGTLDTLYNQITRLWLMDRTKEREDDAAAQSLYRRKQTDYDAVSDEELEAQEFAELFPSFENTLEQERKRSHDSNTKLALHVHPHDAERLASLHLYLFDKRDDTSGVEFERMRSELLIPLLQDRIRSLSESLDQDSLPVQFTMLSALVGKLQRETTPGSYNFYKDARIHETKKAATIVASLRSRLDNLILQWPDQVVLQDIKGRCDHILDLDVQSPIAHILTTLEQLLLHTEDWEIYANKENSLRHHQRLLTDLIVEWRRFELVCWKGLLEEQATEFANQSSEWWFRLYDACIRGPLDTLAQERQFGPTTFDGYLTKLIPILDDYIRKSPLGQFHARMNLLRSFVRYISVLAQAKTEVESAALTRVQCILNSTVSHYEDFAIHLSSKLSKERETLEKEVKDFVKLASWKDINVQALKQSAQKTHHQLYKIVRKFREVLRQPIIHVLEAKQAGDSESEPMQQPHVPGHLEQFGEAIQIDVNEPLAFALSTANHLQNLQRTYARFQALISRRIQPFVRARSAPQVDDLAIQIIATTQELASISIPEKESKERRNKLAKSLLVRKRKAWSDLLKELKRQGLSSNLKADVLSRQQDLRFMREQPVMENIDIEGLSVEREEKYFTRLSNLIPDLRAALANHHTDIGTRELQRGVMFIESGLSLALDIRLRLARAISQYRRLKNLLSRLNALRGDSVVHIFGKMLLPSLDTLRDTLSRVAFALQEVIDGIQILQQLQSSTPIESISLIEEIGFARTETERLRNQVAVIAQQAGFTDTPFMTQDETSVISKAIIHVQTLAKRLKSWADNAPTFRYLLQPVGNWLSAQFVAELSGDSPHAERDRTEDTVNHFLVIVQKVLALCPDTVHEDENDQYLLKDYRNIGALTERLALSETISKLNDFVTALVSSSAGAHAEVSVALPFLEAYMKLLEDQLSMHLNWTTSLFKLEYVLCSIMLTLSRQGFCKPPDAEDEAGVNGTETTSGVGIGSGTGSENVSKDIEDESQVEGLKGEDEDKDQKGEDRKDDGETIEMNEDIGGEMEDVPEKANDEEEGDSDDEDEDEGEPEERMGDLDASDPAAVDEKLWGDEKGPEDTETQDDKLNEDRAQEQSKESEVVAKEGQKPSKKNKEQKDAKEGAQPEEPPEVDDEDIEGEGDERQDEDPKISGAPMDDHVPDANTLDLPDDIDMGNEEQTGEGDDEIMDESNDEEIDEAPDGEEVNQRQGCEEEHFNEGVEQDKDQEMPAQGEGDDETEQDQAPEPDNEAVAKPDVGAGDGDATATDAPELQAGKDSAAGQRGSVVGAGEQGNEGEQDSTLNNDQTQQTQASQSISSMEQDAPGATEGSVDRGASQAQTAQPLATNPIRSLGDAVREIKKYFEDISDASDKPLPSSGPAEAPSQLEYLRPEDDDHNMQALGPAGEEKLAHLNELKMVEDEENSQPGAPMDVDNAPAPEQHQEIPQNFNAPVDMPASDTQPDMEGAVLNHRTDGIGQDASNPDSIYKPKAGLETEELENTAEPELRRWQAMDYPEGGAERIWRLYESLTHDLSYALCEQLRLILEPTLATRLKGDYRTGKRLNMKKIISYIASDYTKDKIWLRRTRPSQREYQVLIALDDSRSMAESHSVHLAYQTLALVSKALNRLESGDVAIAKFGEHVDILHGFDEGAFTDRAGTKVMNAFRFNQKATNVLSLLETSLKALEAARERRAMSTSTAADLWQLEIVISDGMCQDHEKLRTLLRKAEEQRVMVVFIIIDSLHSTAAPGQATGRHAQNSILSMDTAEYKMVNGRMELQLRKYLDSFPFEYYVVLRTVEALPDILSATLKQFFERVSEE